MPTHVRGALKCYSKGQAQLQVLFVYAKQQQMKRAILSHFAGSLTERKHAEMSFFVYDVQSKRVN